MSLNFVSSYSLNAQFNCVAARFIMDSFYTVMTGTNVQGMSVRSGTQLCRCAVAIKSEVVAIALQDCGKEC